MRGLLGGLVLLVSLDVSGAVKESFQAGETLDFNLAWTRISGGAARMTIAPLNGERYRITSIGKSGAFFSRIFKVRDEIESIVSRDTFSTRQYHKRLDERGRKKDELTVIDGSRNLATRNGKVIEVPAQIFDPLSLIYYLRTLELEVGSSHQFTLLADGKLYTVSATVTGRETLTTPAGKFECLVVEPKMESAAGVFRDDQNRLLLWFSDDPRRLPVRIRSELSVGAITATLRRVSKGVGSVEPVTDRGRPGSLRVRLAGIQGFVSSSRGW